MHVKISILYADDTMIEASGHTIETVIDPLQSQIDSLCNCFKHNRLNVNANDNVNDNRQYTTSW